MMTFSMFNREFTISLPGLLVYLLLLSLFCSLGVWQLGRAEQKFQLLAQQQVADDSPGMNLNEVVPEDIQALRYQAAVAMGRYDGEHQFLLDNQIMDGKPGFFVLTPFFVAGGEQIVLVNRGWIPLGKDRNTMPDIKLNASPVAVRGRINQFPSVGIKLKGAEIPGDGWPSLLQRVETQAVSDSLGYRVANFQLELDPSEPEGYRREWKTSFGLPPEKHIAYALQWFALALTLTGLFIWLAIRKSREHAT
jgi:surfeit locus 1 family protein